MKKIVNTNREIEDMPKTFEPLKREYQKIYNIYMAHARKVVKKGELEWESDVTDIEVESYALFWQMLQEFYDYLYDKEREIISVMSEKMAELKTNTVMLEKYGIKIVYDSDTSWYFKKDLDSADWKKIDKKDNENYLKKKKEQK